MNASTTPRHRPDDGCDRDSIPMFSVEETRQYLRARVLPVTETETVTTQKALGRVLAEDQYSPIDVPGANNSAMDGYALASRDAAQEGECRLFVSQRIAAGEVGQSLVPGTAARIFTGAWLPPGADTVVMQERCRPEPDGAITISGPVRGGENVRRIAEDIASGTKILTKGVRLRPQELGLAASVGLERLPVYRRLRVALLCTGDELATPGTALRPGQIYDSNFFTIAGLLQALGCAWFNGGRIPDDPNATREALAHAADKADLVIATGGVSVGEEDHVKAAVVDLGHLDLWRVAVKPGKPLAFGRIGATPFLGLPGNPVSAFVTFCLFVRPFILSSQGTLAAEPRCFPVSAGFEWSGTPKRREYLRARLASADDGVVAEIFPNQSSAVLTSAVWADGLVEIPEGRTVVRNQTVSFIPFSELLS